MLTTDELTAIRADVARLLPETGYLLSLTQISDGQGGFTETWGTATTTPYRLDPVRAQEQLSGAALQPYHTFTLTLPYSVTVTPAQRFQAADGTRYAITAVDGSKSWKASTRATVEVI
jgi:SPP1 family predicted phage head-tail adaptor